MFSKSQSLCLNEGGRSKASNENMAASARAVTAARESVLASRSSSVRPEHALPRRLQACMQELLTVNERYHDLLQASEEQRLALEQARAELSQLKPALATAEARVASQQLALERAQGTADALRQSQELQAARCAAAEAENADLHKVVQGYASRLLERETALAAAAQQSTEYEAWLATHWQSGYEEGVNQRQAETKARLRRVQEQGRQKAEEAFERGKAHSAKDNEARLLREQAERRLLLHRAEEARVNQRALNSKLEKERQARSEAAEANSKLKQRLSTVRHQKESLAGALDATKAAHTADLDHFEQMETALGMACAEYSSLAAKHARSFSPPRARGAGAAAYGCSPPEARRTQPPRPAAITDSSGAGAAC